MKTLYWTSAEEKRCRYTTDRQTDRQTDRRLIRLSKEFWEQKFEQFKPQIIKMDDKSFEFLETIKDNLNGKEVLEIGCGNGSLSVYMAKMGANVTSIDNTENAVRNTLSLAAFNDVSLIAKKMDVFQIGKMQKTYDYIIGRMILHHIEPFDQFVPIMHSILNLGGQGVFYENSSANKLLIFCRTFLVGKFGIPRYGDGVEIPLEKSEIKILKKFFSSVSVTYPRMVFWGMLGIYIFRKSPTLNKFSQNLDKFFYKYLPIFNKYSYHQLIFLKK
jgi:2-polyprenyl-3-methyl-5-hydroxy-6-metoxy-1,4-benzoquinol methylase